MIETFGVCMSEYVEIERLELPDCSYIVMRPKNTSDVSMMTSQSWIHKYSIKGELKWRSQVLDEDFFKRGPDVFVGLTLAKDGSILATSFGGEVYKIDPDTGVATYFKTVK
jgi:outer membrane protein assembly factor BamB